MTPPFNIEGPDDKGNVWLYHPAYHAEVRQYLGHKDQVAEILSQWLGSIDYDD